MPYPADLNFEPAWLRLLRRLVLGHGMLKSTVFLTLMVSVLCMLMSQGVLAMLGRGDRWIALVTTLLCTLLVTPPLCFAGLRLVFALEQARRQLDVLATRDDLTGLHNRRHFMSRVEAEWDRAKRYGNSAALLLIDVDHFKQVNDQHGHLVGSRVLVEVARTVEDTLREGDVVSRYGGDELTALLPGVDVDVAIKVAERVRAAVAEARFAVAPTLRITVCVGVAAFPLHGTDVRSMLDAADRAMYRGKESSRNIVMVATAVPPSRTL